MNERPNLETVTVAAPAAGNPVVLTVPANTVYQVVSFHSALTTDATAIDRLVYARVNTGGVDVQAAPAPAVQPASQVWAYEFSVGIAPFDYSTDFDLMFAPLPCCMLIKSAGTVTVSAITLQAADQFTDTDFRVMVWKES